MTLDGDLVYQGVIRNAGGGGKPSAHAVVFTNDDEVLRRYGAEARSILGDAEMAKETGERVTFSYLAGGLARGAAEGEW